MTAGNCQNVAKLQQGAIELHSRFAEGTGRGVIMRNPIAIVAFLLLAVLLAGNFWLDRRGSARPTDLARIGSAVIAPEVIQSAEHSAFLVVGDNFSASAFLVSSKCGIFASNAHVAEGVEGSAGPVHVRQANTGKTFEIGSVKIHPARKLFERLVDEYGPFIDPNTDKLQPLPVPSAYDAALLYAKGATCDKANSELAALPELKIADQEALSLLKAGDPIALIGFQGHGTTTRDIEWLTVSPRIEVGHVRAIGSYIPIPAGEQIKSQRLKQMVLHTLSTTHGTSGSPMINNKGEVIAVNQGAAAAGDVEGQLVLERIGHRADIISELLSGEESQLISDYKEAIGEYLGRYTSASDMLTFFGQLVAKTSTNARDSRANVTLKSLDRWRASFGPVQTGFVVPDASGVAPFAFSTKGRYFHGRVDLTPGRSYLLSALDYDQGLKIEDAAKNSSTGLSFDYLCPISISVRYPGQSSFVSSPAKQLAFFGIVQATESLRSLEYVVWRHPGCGPDSTSFDFALASYEVTPKQANPALAFFRQMRQNVEDKLETLQRFWRLLGA